MKMKRVSNGVPPSDRESISYIDIVQSDQCYSPDSSFHFWQKCAFYSVANLHHILQVFLAKIIPLFFLRVFSNDALKGNYQLMRSQHQPLYPLNLL